MATSDHSGALKMLTIRKIYNIGHDCRKCASAKLITSIMPQVGPPRHSLFFLLFARPDLARFA
jgi:hypothetical protein